MRAPMLKESVYREEYPPGSHVFREGEPGSCAYVIERGAVEISTLHQGRKIAISSLGEGDLFGEMALVDSELRSSSAMTTEETVVVVISLDQLREKLEQADPLVTFFTRNILERFRDSQSRLLGHSREAGDSDSVGSVLEKDVSLPRHRERAMRKLKFKNEINKALINEENVIHYQPILDLRTGAMAGLEALLRWDHPERGLLYPNDFIGFSEETGLIIPMGLWVLEQSCKALLAFQKKLNEIDPNAPLLFMSINLSSRQFSDIDLVRNISNIIDDTGVNPEQIKLEITESLLMDNPARAAVTLNGVKALGLEIAIDDFGTGYSSLSYLHRFHIDTLKIDRSFVSTATMNKGSMEIVRAIAGLAHNLGLDIVAEGIEQPEQVTLLRDVRCEYGQGFFFSKPVVDTEILSRIEELGEAKNKVTPIGIA
ncbi:MAG: EAL domain-containing protein [Alphaproteobacteria bacterium]|jgi:EAL domain-containing protein (putative c-di-GMP-specific phosphodiesterase class I)/CRP-like cAMP-binding protein